MLPRPLVPEVQAGTVTDPMAFATDGSLIGARAGNGRRRLTPEQIERIRAAHTTGRSAVELAAEFGVDRSRIYQLVGPKNKLGEGYRWEPKTHEHSWVTEDGATFCSRCGAEPS